jgi:hypothetical protein
MAFNLPQRTSIGAQTPVSPAVWTRPADWISITGVSTGEVIFLVSDATNDKYNLDITKTGVGNVYVDWGDGTSTTVSANSVISKTYTTGGTASTLGYNTWKITLTRDVGVRITGAKIVYGTDYSGTPYGLLEAWYGNTTLTSAANYFSPNASVLPYLEYVKLPEGMTDSNSLFRTFQTNVSIRKVDLPTSLSSNTSMNGFANGANNLLEMSDLPQDMISCTDLFQAFDGANSIQKIVCPPTWDSVTSINRFAQNCLALTTLVLPTSMTACTDYGLWLPGCVSLLSVAVPILKPTGSLVIAFNGCTNLRNVTFPNNTPSTLTLDLTNAFNGCSNLQSVILPPNVKVSSYSATFQNCFSLKYVSLPTDATSVTTMANMFNACNSLTSITLPSTAPSAAVSMASLCTTCMSLSEITIPSTYLITSLQNAFQNCRGLKSATLPNNTQNNITDLSGTFNGCVKLQSVVLPTSMTAATTISSMFNSCVSLSGATFPASMPLVTSISNLFNGCNSLISATLPTTILGGNGVVFTNIFTNCQKIKSITLPATIANTSGATSMASCFQNCYSVESITLPTGNFTGLSTATSMFNGCRSLTGVTNMSSIGSSSPTGTILNATTLATDARSLLSLTLVPRLSKLDVNGTIGFLSALNSLRLSNTGTGQWGGTSPQIDVSYTSLSTAALNLLFADMAAQGNVTSKTINITGSTGAAGLSAGDRLVITSKGWTITG